VLQLIRIADQVDCDDTAGTVFDGHRIDRTIAFAQNEAREPVHVGIRWIASIERSSTPEGVNRVIVRTIF